MKFLGWKHVLALMAGLATILLAFGCSSKSKQIVQLVNQLPEVRLTSAPVDTSGLYYYSYTVDWVGYDPDGRVDHYLYTVDPQLLEPGQDTVWTTTTDNEKRLFFRSPEPTRDPNSGTLLGRGFHVFLIKAVDERGGVGPFTARSFYSFTTAPSVRIQNPHPGAYYAFVTPAVRITWSGDDPDGVFSRKPVKYKFIMLSSSSLFPKDLAVLRPDSLRRFYDDYWQKNGLDSAWAGWQTCGGDTTTAQYTNLTPGQDYVFAVIGFDEAGAYSPFFSLQTNMVRLKVQFASSFGPKITMFNEYFNYTYVSGGYCVCPAATVSLEVPAKQPIDVNWSAEPPQGSDITAYRWTLDIDNVFDDTPRSDDLKDVKHWSSPSANTTTAILGPFAGGEQHLFYIEAVDNNGVKSLGILRLIVVEPTLEKPLLVVDDTRLRADIRQAGSACVQTPSGLWPTRAEMDTFMFAKGGFPWQCYPNPDQKSVTGLLGLYRSPGNPAVMAFDTVGTRIGKADLTVPLSIIGKYAHLIWLTEAGPLDLKPGTDPINPSTALRYMSTPGHINTLGAYVKSGGKLWLAGGGAALAASDPFDNGNNNQPLQTFDVNAPGNELGPGRFMYDIVKWQSQYKITRGQAEISRAPGRFTGLPDYAGLPEVLEPKSAATDPLDIEAPTRTPNSLYQTVADLEFLSAENRITQNVSTNPDIDDEQSTLDTLYRVSGNIIPDFGSDPERTPAYVIMTYFHGPAPQNQTTLFSGFAPWWPQRPEAQQLVDFVMQNMWGFVKNGVPGMPASARSAAHPVAKPRAAAVAPAKQPVQRPVTSVMPWSPKYPRD